MQILRYASPSVHETFVNEVASATKMKSSISIVLTARAKMLRYIISISVQVCMHVSMYCVNQKRNNATSLQFMQYILKDQLTVLQDDPALL